MRLQIRPNGPLLLAKAWAAGRSCPWAPRPARGPIIPDDRSGQERAASLSFLRLMRLPGLFRRIGGGGLGGALRLGLGAGFAFFGRAFCRFAPKLPLSPPRAPAARGADRIGALPSSFSSSAKQAREESGEEKRKRGKEEKAGKAGKAGKTGKTGKTGIKAAEGLREPRKEWRRRQSGGHKKSPEKSGLAGEGGAVDRDRPPAA